MANTTIIETHGLTRLYKENRAVDSLDLALHLLIQFACV